MENEENVGTEVTTQKEVETTTKKTLDELLASDKDYQSEYDKKVTQAMNTRLDNERKKWEEEQKNKLAEAEKLAKMDEEQKKNYEIAQWKERAEKAEKLNAISQLKSETIKQATEKGISLEFINTINFEFETAETIKSKLEILEKAVKKEREVAISEYSKEDAPFTGDKVDAVDTNNMTYSQMEEYLRMHPNAKI